MTDRFDICVEHILSFEGGYVNHPRDPGKATNRGITIGTLGRYLGRRTTISEVKAITEDLAKDIYKKMYWDKTYCDRWSAGLDLVVFDCCVNQGEWDAKRFLQRAARVREDGVIGPITTGAVQEGSQRHILHELLAIRMQDYGNLKGLFGTFGLGWSRRLMATAMVATEMQLKSQ